MNTLKLIFATLSLLTISLSSTGCRSIDRLGAKMDMAVNRVSEQGKPEYEGKLIAIKVMGPLTAIELEGGKYYDVIEASPGLVPGDIVRVYHTEKGYEARLWKQVKFQPVMSEAIQPVRLQTSGS